LLLAVDPEKALPELRNHIVKLANKNTYPEMPEYLEDHLKTNKAFLFMDTSGSDSFVVLSTHTCPYRKVRTLFVLAAFCGEGDADKLYGEQVDQLAREAECTEVEFVSSRRGWERAAKKYGYSPVEVTYRKKLNG